MTIDLLLLIFWMYNLTSYIKQSKKANKLLNTKENSK